MRSMPKAASLFVRAAAGLASVLTRCMEFDRESVQSSAMEYLRAAESLAFFATALSWGSVWKWPTGKSLSIAGFATSLTFGLAATRLALGIVLASN